MWGGVGCCERENSKDASGVVVVGTGGEVVDLVAQLLHELAESSGVRASVQE